MLKLDNIGYRYKNGDRDVLKDVSANFEGGRLHAVVGPSGSGKTTLADTIKYVDFIIQITPSPPMHNEPRREARLIMFYMELWGFRLTYTPYKIVLNVNGLRPYAAFVGLFVHRNAVNKLIRRCPVKPVGHIADDLFLEELLRCTFDKRYPACCVAQGLFPRGAFAFARLA